MLLSSVPQGSILEPLILNICICNIFFEMLKNIDFAGYADDNTPYTYSSDIEDELENLQGALEQLLQWFSANHLVANAGKCHLLTTFITSQFSYCPLVWMFHSRTMNNRINTLHEKALRLVYTNKSNLSFDALLK